MVRDAATALASWKDPASWTSYRNVRFGFTLRYPSDISVLVNRTSPMSASIAFAPAMAGRHCELSERPTWSDRTLAQYQTELVQERYANATFDYAPRRDTWFVLSGVAGDNIFYERVTFACDRPSFH